MKKYALMLLLAGLFISFIFFGFDYYRESHLLKSSGLGLSRMSVNLVYSSEKSINFGADSTAEFGFALPPELDGTKRCGTGGYSNMGMVDLAGILKLPGAPQSEIHGCVRRFVTDKGTTYLYVLSPDRIFIKIM